MADYDQTFTKRGREYKYAVETYPHVLQNEFQTAADVVCSTNPATVLNIPASCVPLGKYLPSSIAYHEFESNKTFSLLTDISHCTLSSIPLPSESVDTIVCIASLHHATSAERLAFYSECLRLLRSGGSLVIGDVIADSPQDRWLNEFVDRYNSSGHKGIFWSEKDCDLFKTAGFEKIDWKVHAYTWNFHDSSEMLDFTRNLFGLDLATDVILSMGLRTYLHASDTQIPWSLCYFVATKADLIRVPSS